MIVDTMYKNTMDIITKACELSNDIQDSNLDQILNLQILQQNNYLMAIALNTAVIADRLTEISFNLDKRR